MVAGTVQNIETDAGWVRLAVDGQRAGQSALYHAHSRRLLGLAIRLLRDHSEAEDLVHDVFLIAFAKIDQLQDASKFGSWISSILVRRAQHRLRRRRLAEILFVRDVQSKEGFLESLMAPDASPFMLAELRAFERNLGKLGAELRATWILRHVEGYKLTEIAELTGCSLATVKRRISNAENKIASWIEPATASSPDTSGVFPRPSEATSEDQQRNKRTRHASS